MKMVDNFFIDQPKDGRWLFFWYITLCHILPSFMQINYSLIPNILYFDSDKEKEYLDPDFAPYITIAPEFIRLPSTPTYYHILPFILHCILGNLILLQV